MEPWGDRDGAVNMHPHIQNTFQIMMTHLNHSDDSKLDYFTVLNYS